MSTAQAVLTKLAAYDLKPVGPNKYRSRSPLRAGATGKTNFSLVIYDEEHGGYYDWGDNSHLKGSLYDLAKHLGVELPTSSSPGSSKRRYSDMGDYALQHGSTAEIFAAAGWSLVTHQERPALAFITESGTRYRYLDGEKPAFKSPSGYKKCWYGLRRADTLQRLAGGQPLVLANGEASVVVAHSYGLAVACVTAGEMDYPPHLVQQLKDHLGSLKTPILIAFDCDQAGRSAARQVEETLRAHGFNAQAVNLGLGDQGQDLADFCRLFGEDSCAAIKQLPRLTVADTHVIARRNWQIVNRAYLRTLPPVKWLIEGDIQQNAINVAFGPSGAGKSFLVIHYAALLAQSMNVVYMAGEGEYGLDGRLTAWERHHLTVTDRGLSICLGAVEIIQEGDLMAFIEEIRPLNPGLVVVDTLARAMMTGDENDARDMKRFIQACEIIRDQLQTTIILVHHTNKEGIFERGSGVLRASVDVMLKVTAEDDLIRVEKSKSKEAAALQAAYYTLLPVEVEDAGKLYKSAVLIPSSKVIQTAQDRLTKGQNSILEFLAIDPDAEQSASEIGAATNINHGPLTRALTTLRKLGYLYQSLPRQPYRITPQGLAKIAPPVESLASLESPIFENVATATPSEPSEPTDSSDASDSSDATIGHSYALASIFRPSFIRGSLWARLPDPDGRPNAAAPMRVASVESPAELDPFETYAINELGADIKELPPVQTAFISKPVNYG